MTDKKEKKDEEAFIPEDLVELTKEQITALPDGVSYVKSNDGRYFLHKNKKEESKKEVILVEDLTKGYRFFLESESETMPQLMNHAKLIRKEMFNVKPKGRKYIG